MKNINKWQLKKCIVAEPEEFEKIIHGFDEDATIAYDYDGIDITMDTDELYKNLAEYYGVKEVTSLHTDGYDSLLVWIVYKD